MTALKLETIWVMCVFTMAGFRALNAEETLPEKQNGLKLLEVSDFAIFKERRIVLKADSEGFRWIPLPGVELSEKKGDVRAISKNFSYSHGRLYRQGSDGTLYLLDMQVDNSISAYIVAASLPVPPDFKREKLKEIRGPISFAVLLDFGNDKEFRMGSCLEDGTHIYAQSITILESRKSAVQDYLDEISKLK